MLFTCITMGFGQAIFGQFVHFSSEEIVGTRAEYYNQLDEVALSAQDCLSVLKTVCRF